METSRFSQRIASRRPLWCRSYIVVAFTALGFISLVTNAASAMVCEDLFQPREISGLVLSTAAPAETPLAFWNLAGKNRLKQLDLRIADVVNPQRAEDFEPAVVRATEQLSKMGNEANSRLGTLTSAIFSHAREFPDTSFARNVVYHLIHGTAHQRYAVEQLYLRLKKEKRKKTSEALAASIFAYGRIAQDAIVEDTLQSLQHPEALSDTELQNLFLLSTHLLRPRMERKIREFNEGVELPANEALLLSHYWYHFFENGDRERTPNLSDAQAASLILAVRSAGGARKLSPEARKSYLITVAFAFGNRVTLQLKRELTELARPLVAAPPDLFTDSTSADLWLAYRLVHRHHP